LTKNKTERQNKAEITQEILNQISNAALEDEIIKLPDDLPGYAISNKGRVFTYKYRKGLLIELKSTINSRGYFRVRLSINQEYKSHTIHRLVATYFVPKLSDDLKLVRHLDGDKTNNSSSNLAWGTHSENAYDSIRHGTFAKGSKNGNAKLNEQQVSEIKSLLILGVGVNELGRKFNVNNRTISGINKEKNWRDIKAGVING
jgi:hypothetical protein